MRCNNNRYVPSNMLFSNVYIREVIKEEIIAVSDTLKGDSAYEVAVKLGYKGNEEEWLSEQGATIEQINVNTGEAGTDASVVLNGTPKNRIIDLTIPKGDKGIQGEKGDKGDKGIAGRDGSYVQKAYKTYAGMVADKDSIPTNSNVVVNNDPDKSNNAFYTYDGTEFTKSDFDPQGILTTVDVRLNQAVESASDYFQSQVADTIDTSINNSTVAYTNAINTTKAQVVADAKAATESALDTAVTDLFENGGLPATPFATKALMTASSLVDGKYAMVTDDTVNNGLYVKTAGAWVKSEYDPLTQAKADATIKANAAEANAINYADSKLGELSDWVENNTLQQNFGQEVFKNQYAYTSSGEFLGPAPAWAGWRHTDYIPVKAGDTVKIVTRVSAVGLPYLIVYDQNKVRLKFFTVTSAQAAELTTFTHTFAQDGFFVTQHSTDVTGCSIVINEGESRFLRPREISLLENLYNTANNVKGVGLNTSGEVVSGSAFSLNIFPVIAGMTYAIKAEDLRPVVAFVSLRETESAAVGSVLAKIVLEDTPDPLVKTFTIPQDTVAKYGLINVRVVGQSFNITSSAEIYIGGIIPTTKDGNVYKISGKEIADFEARKTLRTLTNELGVANNQITEILPQVNSKLKNKKWCAIGDSITEKNFRSNQNYHYYISQAVGGMTVYNYGIGGTGFYDRHDVADNISESDIDIITVFLGTNDYGNKGSTSKPLGSFGDTGTSTISGCIDTLLMGLLNKFPTKKIAVFTPLPRLNNWGSNATPNAQGYTLEQLSNIIMAYAKHYSIPCLDLYHESSLPMWIPAANTAYFKISTLEPDGLHPNDAGHQVLATKIQKFLEGI